MNVVDAAHAIVHDYPGGSIALAPRVGMSAAILRGKVNPNDAGHHLTIAESVRMQQLTGDHRILEAEAEELGYALLPLSPESGESDVGLRSMSAMALFGEMIGEIEAALRDGRITQNELRKIERRLFAHLSSVRDLHMAVAAKVGKR